MKFFFFLLLQNLTQFERSLSFTAVDSCETRSSHSCNWLKVPPLFALVFFSLQMFILDKVEDSSCTLHEFSITGSTYAPEGQM